MGESIEYGEINEVLQRITGGSMEFQNMVDQLKDGGSVLSRGAVWEQLKSGMVSQLQDHRTLIGYLILLIVGAAILNGISKAFRNRQISDMGFYMIYLLLFLVIFQSFLKCYEITEEVLGNLIDFMKVLMPAYLGAAAAAAYTVTAAAYYEGFLFLVYCLQKLVLLCLLPAVKIYCVLVMVSFLMPEELFSRCRGLLKSGILMAMKLMVTAAAGLQLIQGMISPAIDQLHRTTISRGIGSIGALGGTLSGVLDIVLGSGMLLKNGIGAAAAVIIVVVSLTPVVEVGGYMVFYQLLGAASEPVSDKRITGAIGEMGEGMGLLVRLLLTVAALFLLTISIVCMTTGGIR